MTMTFATVSCSQRASEHLASLNVAYLDTIVAPGADFYTYVNKGLSLIHI